MNIALLGQAGSGKDFTADYLIKTYGYKRIAQADVLKLHVGGLLCHEAAGYSRCPKSDQEHIDLANNLKHLPFVRGMLQYYGDWLKHERGETILLQMVAEDMLDAAQHHRHPSTKWVCTDVRLPFEADILSAMGFVLARVMRLDAPTSVADSQIVAHKTEAQQAQIVPDVTLYNAGDPSYLKVIQQELGSYLLDPLSQVLP